jgi:uncharacterized repeat protein (TIGR01451 family)
MVDRSTLLSNPETEGRQKFTEEHAVVLKEVDGKDPVRFVVILPDKPLATYKGEVGGLAATAPSVTGTKLNVKTPESQAYLKFLQAQQSAYLTTASNVLGYTPKVLFQYQYGTNGFSMMLTPDEAVLLAAQTGVKVLRAPIETPDTDEGPSLIGAPAIWNGETATGVDTYGEGVLVGIIDTGINFDHPSFSATPEDGYVYDWTGDYLGVCDPTNAEQYDPDYAIACNDKLVGAFTYVADDPVETSSPEDSEGHGSHTASTVAGNFVEVEFQGVSTTISGVAPHAQVISFDVCVPEEPNGACYGDATVAAVEDAILNGVDVLNYSISGGANPYGDPVELAFLAATEAGIFVSTSAGNAGDTTGESSVAHRSPWVSTVAAASHGRIFANAVDITGPGTVPPELIGLGAVQAGPLLTADLVDLPIKYDPANLDGCAAFAAGFFDGAIALIQRGTCNFSVKEANAYAAGAEYVLIFNSRTGAPAGMAGIVIGAAMISMEDGMAIKTWIDANPTATATMNSETSRIYNANYEDIIAGFSSYGPNTTFDVLKPDITGPGVSILAAVADGTITPSPDYEIELYQGTSMSSPHNAGAAALMMALHPDWTPMQVRSAMMMTAEDGMRADRFTIEGVIRPATPQDEGAGRIALENAAMVGLVMDETIENFEAADPTLDGTPSSLNLASLYSSKCVGECTWTRTFTSVANASASYTVVAPEWVTVAPATFTINPGAEQVITFTADVSAFPSDEWLFGSIEFLTDDVHLGDSTELLSEGFEVWPPAGWTIDAEPDSCDTWLSSTDTESSNLTGGTGLAADANSDYCGDAMDTWMISPSLDFSGFDGVSLQFKSDFNDYGNVDDGYVDVSLDGGTTWTNVFHYDSADFRGPRTEIVDLSAYAGQTTVTLRFHYVAPDWDWWWQVDDVLVTGIVGTGALIADLHIPLAVLPTSSNIPSFLRFETHRDAALETVSDLVAVEITDGNTYESGLVVADLETFTLDPDPTNSDPVDDISQVFVKKFDVPAYSIRLVAEITESTSLDLDMFLYYDQNGDGMLSSADYLVASSATGAVLEYLNAPKDWIYWPAVDTYFIVVQNWNGAVGDTVTLASAIVPLSPEVGNYDVIVPATNPAGVPFSMDIAWNEDTSEGDRMYGYFETCADTDCELWIGSTDLDIVRLADDVVKTADVTEAGVGDVITYTIEVTNFEDTDTLFTIEDALPEGVTYVPDSVTGAAYDAGTNTISWAGTVAAGAWKYLSTTSAEDAACTLAIMPDGDPIDAYLDWKTTSLGFSTSASISGDSKWYGTFSTYAPFNYYGVDYIGMEFTDDGYAGFAMNDIDYNNQELPDPLDPNNILAMFWDDFVIQYDAATNKGVTMVGDGTSFATIEYDDLYLYDGDTAVTLDVEVGYFLQPDNAPGAYEIVYAFDNIHPDLLADATATIGLENADGTAGNLISYNDPALSIEDGSAICFDWKYVPAEAHVITFQVTVDEDVPAGLLTNVAMHDNDKLGTVEEGAVATVTILEALKNLYLPLIMR